MTKTNTKAFTLIELLIVIVIIGILAVALIPRLTGAQASARDTARKANVQQIVTGIEAYKAEKNGKIVDVAANATAVETSTLTGLVGNYLQALPKDPSTKSGFVFSNGTNYAVCQQVERAANGNYDGVCGAAAIAALTGGTLTPGSGMLLVSGQ